MKNPLYKRIPREFKADLGKYLVIFLFLVMLISLVSAFLVADTSVSSAYDEGFKKYNIEDGHLSFNKELSSDLISDIEAKANLTLYDLRYFEEAPDGTDKNIRVYKDREDVNLECLMSGEMPEADNEIALDRMYAENNDIKVGDSLSLAGRELIVSGLIALPDYSCLFENNSDMMFDSINFCVAVMSESGFEAFNSSHITYNYAWTYPEFIERTDEKTANTKSEAFIEVVEDVIIDYDSNKISDVIDASKVIMVRDLLDEIAGELSAYGMDISIYDNAEGCNELLEMINSSLEAEGIDLTEEFRSSLIENGATEDDIDELITDEVVITVDDIKAAMNCDDEEYDALNDYINSIDDDMLDVNDYLPRYLNQAIIFTGDDMGGDKAMFIMFDYIIVIVIAFIFAVTTSNTISQEAGVIGTLRASGYTRGEIIRHYMVLPVATTILAGIIGNILGYTVLKQSMVDLYYASYSLATYKTVWSSEAFLLTTVVPIILMFLINLFVLTNKLKLSPLRFLRRDLSKRGKKKAFKLNTKIPILHRFRIRIIFQNIPNYLTMFFGVFMGGVIIVYGTMFGPLLEDYSDLIVDTALSNYQYILMDEAKTQTEGAEKFAMTSLKTTNEKYVEDEVGIYGIVPGSEYIKTEIPEGKVIISIGMAEKFGYENGDVITLKDTFTSDTYDFTVGGVYDYYGSMSIFMSIDEYNNMFDNDSDYFTGYFSNTAINDISTDEIAGTITIADLTKASDQLIRSMGDFMSYFEYFGIIMFILIIYVLSKQIIEKNAQSISMTKILGFRTGEIGGLYIITTSIIVIASLLISIPIIDLTLRWAFSSYLYTAISGYIPYIISNNCYITLVVLGILSYVVVAALLLLKINKIPKSDALKNVE